MSVMSTSHVSPVASSRRASSALRTHTTLHSGMLRRAISSISETTMSSSITRTLCMVLIRGADESVPYTMQGQEMDWHLGVGLELLPKPDNVRVNSSRVGYGLITPYRIEQDVASQGTIFVMEKERQQVVLGGSE